jgi:IclR family transcriptional regulator, pca regulon regulatory protein
VDKDGDIMAGFAKGLQVIEAFDEDHDALSIADVGRLTGLDRATARRCLLTLVRGGYASFDGRLFELTPRVLRLGYAYMAAAPLPRQVQPFLERLSEVTQESCSAAIMDGPDIVYIARAAQRRVMSIALNIGSRLPAYCSSMGRVLLAAMEPEEARALLNRTERRALTSRTLTQVDRLMAELERVRQEGFALVDEELELGLRSIAVPIVTGSGRVVAALNTGAQAARASSEHLKSNVLPHLLNAQAELRRLLV